MLPLTLALSHQWRGLINKPLPLMGGVGEGDSDLY